MKIIILGGGTSGWITALYAKKARPADEITLVESPTIGILGAGEGTTPQFINLLDFLEIPASIVIKDCQATIKSSIRFMGWSGESSSYHHPFISRYPVSTKTPRENLNPYLEKPTEDFFIYNSVAGYERRTFVLAEAIEDQHKVPFIDAYLAPDTNIINPIQHFQALSDWALHFDARLLAEFLQNVAVSRGVRHVLGSVTDASQNSSGDIECIHVDGQALQTDFIFDCSGFKSFISSNVFKARRTSHRKFLPADKAQAFFLDIDPLKIPAYTESICMDAGWMWKIPLQHRWGCGYVYSSDFIDQDSVINEILTRYPGARLGNQFSFPSDHLVDIWQNNCLSVGLSTGFIEPLEATSIFHIIRILGRFFSEPLHIERRFEPDVKSFNNKWRAEIEEIIDFIHLHYLASGTRSTFWNSFRNITIMPDFVNYMMEISKYRPPNEDDFYGREMFTSPSYTHVMYGNGILGRDVLRNYFSKLPTPRVTQYTNALNNQLTAAETCLKHHVFLSALQNGDR